MSYLNSQYTTPSLNGIIEIYGDEITATNANIDNLTLNNLEIKNLVVDESLNVPYANVTNIQTNTLFSNNGEIMNLIGNTLNFNNITGNINIENGYIGNINIENANVNNLVADSLNVFAMYANIGEIDKLDGININYNEGNINNFTANISNLNISNINDLKGDYIKFNEANLINLTSNISFIKNSYGENLNYNNANIGNLEVTGKLLLDNLEIENFTTKKVFSEKTVNYTQSSTNINVNKLKCRDAFIRKSNLMPTGTMIHNFNTTFCKFPDWILCDGRYLRVSQFEDLYLVIGDTFGYREINGYPEFKIFNGQGLFIRSFNDNGEYYDGRVRRNKLPADGPQNDNMKNHTHQTTMLYDESFNQFASGGSVGASGINNIRNYTSGSLNQTQTSTTYTIRDNNNFGNIVGTTIEETYPMYISAYLYIKS